MKKCTRRDFIKGSLLMGGAFLFGGKLEALDFSVYNVEKDPAYCWKTLFLSRTKECIYTVKVSKKPFALVKVHGIVNYNGDSKKLLALVQRLHKTGYLHVFIDVSKAQKISEGFVATAKKLDCHLHKKA